MSEFRVEKARADAILTLSDGTSIHGCFYVAGSSATHDGPERVKDVLISETGFFPFGDGNGERTVLYNRSHVVMVRLTTDHEPRLEPGFEVATPRSVSVLLSGGTRILGTVRVYRPQGRDRLSDFARSSETFRYVEIPDGTLIVNVAHIIEISETTPS